MIFGSICSGIEAVSVASHPLGWRAAFLSEIEKFPRAVLAHRFPSVPLHGDFTTIEAGAYEPIELLVGGTPCQDFSVAGLRAGLDGERGQLTIEFVRLAGRLRPRWLVWENVPGVLSSDDGRAFGAFLWLLGQCGYGFAYRVLDAQHFGVPQRRRRVFVVGYLGDWRPPAAVLFERESLQGHSAPRHEAGQAIASGIGAGSPRSGQRIGRREAADNQLIPETVGALSSNGGTGRKHGHGMGQQDWESGYAIAHSLRADGFDAGEDGTGLALAQSAVRRLTPMECERLQGFPDGWTAVPYRGKAAADGPRYRALGNSMAVPCMHWIGERIAAVNELLAPPTGRAIEAPESVASPHLPKAPGDG